MKTSYPSFAESYLIGLLESRLLLEPMQMREARRGIERALYELRWDSRAPLERLAQAIESLGMGSNMALINLMNLPLGTLWVRAALLEARRKLQDQPKARIIIVGLWQVLKGKSGRRTEYVEKRFEMWRDFVEMQLAATNIEDLRIVWLG